MNDVILKSALVYQYLYLKNFKTYISIDEVFELNDNEIGLIGPGLVVLLVGVVPVKLGYRRSKRNRIDVYIAFSLLKAGIVLCPTSIFCKSLHLIIFTNLN